jgi:hypothetical protein
MLSFGEIVNRRQYAALIVSLSPADEVSPAHEAASRSEKACKQECSGCRECALSNLPAFQRPKGLHECC